MSSSRRARRSAARHNSHSAQTRKLRTFTPHCEAVENRTLLSFVVTNTHATGAGSFEQAVIDANNAGGGEIDFNIGGSGVQVIPSTSVILNHAITINGTTEPGYSGTPVIELQESAVTIESDDCVVEGLWLAENSSVLINDSSDAIVSDNVFSALIDPSDEAGPYAVGIEGLNATQNVIEGNLIGTNLSGDTGMGYYVGVDLYDGASANTIGGSTFAEENVISGNAYGLLIDGDDNLIAGNLVGTSLSGDTAVYTKVVRGNGATYYDAQALGIAIGGSNNTIGGTAAGLRNVISANRQEGISLVLCHG
jgi:titin